MSFHHLPFFSLILILLLVACGPETDPREVDFTPINGENDGEPNLSAFSDFQEAIEALMEEYDITGGSIAVAHQGRLVYQQGLGHVDEHRAIPTPAETRFRIASLSKPITSAAIYVLLERGELDLDDLVVPLLGEPFASGSPQDERWHEIRVRHLLEHSGGWDRNMTFDPVFDSWLVSMNMGESPPAGVETLISYMYSFHPLEFDPGSRYAYSNLGYVLLGRIIETISGRTYAQFVADEVFTPMGITSMEPGRTLPEDRPADEAFYHPSEDEPTAQYVFSADSQEVPFPDGGFYLEPALATYGWITTASDMVRFAVKIPDFLRSSSVARRTARPELPEWDDGGNHYYAHGWGVTESAFGPIWSHNGRLPGTYALVRYFNGTAFSLLFNRSPRLAQQDDFSADCVALMWELVNGVRNWPSHDLWQEQLDE